MVLADFLTETRRKWLQAFKLFKSKKNKKGTRNRVSPALDRCALSGTVDARPEIDVQRFCPCRAPLGGHEEDRSYYSCSSDSHSLRSRSGRSDSAYESDARSSPAHRSSPAYFPALAASPAPRPYVTYCAREDDSSSVRTEYTLLDYEPPDEEQQNIINESIELVTTL